MLVEYGDCILHLCTINGIPSDQNSFACRSIKVFEDHCKPYLTAQLVIDSYQNSTDTYLWPTAEVIVSFEAPGMGAPAYTERFRVFSHESEEVPTGQHVAHKIHTISLIGQEYYNDKHNNVQQMAAEIPATTAAAQIHTQYIAADKPGLIVIPSSGPIGSIRQPHQSSNLKPFKAIYDLLDRAVWTAWPTCCPVYFRNQFGHTIAPLQSQLDAGPMAPVFLEEHQAQGARDLQQFKFTPLGYQSIMAIKPISPSADASSGVKASEVSGLLKAASFFDMNQGNFTNLPPVPNFSGFGVPGLGARISQLMGEAYRGNRGGGALLNIINEVMQARAIQKAGPGGFNTQQEALITALAYTNKFWVQVPGQSGLLCTAGMKVPIRYTTVRGLSPVPVDKILYIARLVHHITFLYPESEKGRRQRSGYKAKTEIYGVEWK